jgi:ABC-2 type transport system permease protein
VTLDVRPAGAAASRPARVRAHARLELTMLLRNGEQLLLTAVLPIGLLLLLTLTDLIDIGPTSRAERLDVAVPSMFALAVLSTSFTALAIQTGFERRYGVLRRIGTTPLSRLDVLLGKASAVLLVEAAQVVVLAAVGWALGWRPEPGGVALSVPLILLGSAALGSLALLLAGVVRAEATLAIANLAYLVFVGVGVVVPVSQLPDAAETAVILLPGAALAEALRQATQTASVDLALVGVLVVWTASAAWAVRQFFRWE